MNFAPTTASSARESPRLRLRNAAVATLFAVVRQTPRLLRIRQNQQSWTTFRFILGFAGAALVMFPLSHWNSWFAAIVGLAMFLAAILLPPAPAHSASAEKAHDLGARVVVNGGKYQPGNIAPASVKLFVGTEQVCALDAHLQQLLVIPVSDICSVSAAQEMDRWILQILWSGNAAEFSYQGLFAERQARDAQNALEAVIPRSRPVLQRSRAAGA